MDALIVAIICVFALIAGVIAIYENDLFSTSKKILFFTLAGLIIVEICGDTFLLMIVSKNLFSNDIYKLLKIIELIPVPVIPALFSVIIAHREFWKRIWKVFLVLIIVNTLFQIISFFIPIMFIYNNSTFTITPFTFFYIFIIIISTILFLICSANTFVQSKRISITLIAIVLLILVGMVLRMIDISSNVDWMCISFSYFLFLFHFSGIYLKIDPLTTLLNRKSFDIRLEKSSMILP